MKLFFTSTLITLFFTTASFSADRLWKSDGYQALESHKSPFTQEHSDAEQQLEQMYHDSEEEEDLKILNQSIQWFKEAQQRKYKERERYFKSIFDEAINLDKDDLHALSGSQKTVLPEDFDNQDKIDMFSSSQSIPSHLYKPKQ